MNVVNCSEVKSGYTIRELIKNTGLDKLDLKLLLRYVLNMNQAQLIINSEYELTSLEYVKLHELVKQCLAGQPVNYLIGYREFYSRNFKVTPDTLIPRPETEFLVEQVLTLAKQGFRLLDLGTGSGCIAISCKLEYPELEVIACDNSVKALAVAHENAKSLNAELDFVLSNWYENITSRFDIIVSNPPYIAKDDQHLVSLTYEPQTALTDFADGLDCFRIIISGAAKHLTANGWLILEHGFDQGAAVREMLSQSQFKQIETISDYANLERITYAKLLN